MATTYIVDKDGNQIDAASATVPSDRHFRGAWSLSGKVISEDMTKAKEIFRDKIRELRKELLEEEDVVYMKALEADDASAKTASVAKKKKLRDAPAASAITNADTIAKLKAAWDTDVLGDSPYAQDKKMSTLNVNLIADNGGSSNVGVQGEGTATTNLSQGLVKHWATATTDDIVRQDSFNNSSITDEGSHNGDGTYAFINSFANGDNVRIQGIDQGDSFDDGTRVATMSSGDLA